MLERITIVAAVLCGMLSLPGCGGYVINGKVVRGEWREILFVDPADERLDGVGLPHVRVSIDRDPEVLGRRTVGWTSSDNQGRFAIHLDEFGAGWMVERWGIRASRQGYQTVDALVKLPRKGSGRQLLIVLPAGSSGADEANETLLEQYERFKK